MPSDSPISQPPSGEASRQTLRWSNWNLLLLLPLVALATPLYNSDKPRLFGFPYFYWQQFLFVPLGVLCVWVVYRKTSAPKGDADGGAPR